jgi:hypothetical protein
MKLLFNLFFSKRYLSFFHKEKVLKNMKKYSNLYKFENIIIFLQESYLVLIIVI